MPTLPPSSFIVNINKSAIPTGWTTANAAGIVLELTSVIHVDLFRISTDDATLFAWLKANDQYIDFPSMYATIELAHIIPASSAEYAVASAVASTAYTSITHPGLLIELASNQLSYSDHYNEYLRVYYDSTTLRYAKTTDITLDTLFSVPFIRAIMSNHGLSGTNTVFSFAKGNFAAGSDIFFKVTEGGNFVGFYNYSRRNPRP